MNLKTQRILASLVSSVMILSLIPGIILSQPPPAPSAASGAGLISITKKEFMGDTPLNNTQVIEDVTSGTSVTAGNIRPEATNTTNPNLKYYVVNGTNHFVYAHLDVEAVKSSPNGINLDIVEGNNFDKKGSANVKIIDNKIIFTVNNFVSTGGWSVLVWSKIPANLGNPNSLVKHENTKASITIDMPPPDNGFIDLYFHTNKLASGDLVVTATPFHFQIQRYDNGVWKPTPISMNNILFTTPKNNDPDDPDEIRPVVKGCGVVGDGSTGEFTLAANVTASIFGLPPGQYRIIEMKNDAYIAEVVIGATGDLDDWYTDGDGNVVANLTVSEGGQTLITFENKMEVYRLEITKEVTDTAGVILANTDEFEIRVAFDGPAGMSFSAIEIEGDYNRVVQSANKKEWTVWLSNEKTVAFTNLPFGTQYQIDEPNLRPSYKIDTINSSTLSGGIERSDPNSVKLVNIYEPVAELSLKATKTVSGAPSNASWKFDFDLFASDETGLKGALLDTKSADNAHPTAEFDTRKVTDPLSYYLIEETSSGGSYWTYDPKLYLVRVEAIPSGSSPGITAIQLKLKIKTESTGFGEDWSAYGDSSEAIAAIVFENSYGTQPADLSLPITKVVNKGAPAGDFRFTVTDAQTGVFYREYAGHMADATFTITNIRFTQAGHYELIVSEDDPDPAGGWFKNTQAQLIYVRVVDDGTGQLKAIAYKSYNSRTGNYSGEIRTARDLVFNNTYSPDLVKLAPVSLQLKASKTVTGGAPLPWAFQLELFESADNGRQGASLGSKVVSNTGAQTSFEALQFESTGIYYYLVKEISIGGNGWAVSEQEYLIQVTVQENNGALTTALRYKTRLDPDVDWSRNWQRFDDETIQFINAYATPEAGKASLPLRGAKTVDTGAPEDTFSFSVRSAATDALYSKASQKWPGSFSFEPISFTAADVAPEPYAFVITEEEPSGYWKRNTDPILIYVLIEDKGILQDGTQISATAFLDEACTILLTASDLIFDNTYTQAKANDFFDLALVKYVSYVNGRPTGQTGTESDPGPTMVRQGDKVNFSIRIVNQGTLAGHAEEITDYIPEGFDFVQEDNWDWRYDPDTRKAKTSIMDNVLLVPDAGEGESGYTVDIVLTVRPDVLIGSKLRNIAEISRISDENFAPVEDIDSTPDDVNDDYIGGDNVIDENGKMGGDEDDHDYADVQIRGQDNEDEGYTLPDDNGRNRNRPDPRSDQNTETENEEETETATEPEPEPVSRFVSEPEPEQIPETRPPATGRLELTPQGTYIEFGEDDTPLGEWRWDEDLEEWVFDEFPPPLGSLPATGDNEIPMYFTILAGFCLINLGCACLRRRLSCKASPRWECVSGYIYEEKNKLAT
ncbi:MAG: hypothetical protein FWH28_01355 [Clostridiales bacterium]|nr:hypothetical protein [Clostridiales bacterium]